MPPVLHWHAPYSGHTIAHEEESLMGTFSSIVNVGNPDGGDTIAVEGLVDTGASHSMFPASLLDGLRISRRSQVDATLADGCEVSYWRGRALADGRNKVGYR